MDSKYQDFIKFLFDREECNGDWRFDLEPEEPDLSGEEVVEYVQRMLKNYESDLANYTDWQLGLGIDYIFNNSCSDLSFYLRDGPAPVDKRVAAILALKVFFEKCLDKRCVPSLSHLSEKGNKLNQFCYMVWDITPLTYCEETFEKQEIYSAVAEVMKYSLSLDNIACIEGGLHGLGHLELYFEEAPIIVREFINSYQGSDKRLLEYARNAEQGYVQ